MKNNDKPTVEVKLAKSDMTASVTITFPFMVQALAFGDLCRTLLEKMSVVAKAPAEVTGEEKEVEAPMKSSVLTWNDLKKETQLLIFMMNRAESTGAPFEVGTDGEEAAFGHGIARTKKCLQSQLYQLKLKGYVANVSRGQWVLTTDGKKEASRWMKRYDMM